MLNVRPGPCQFVVDLEIHVKTHVVFISLISLKLYWEMGNAGSVISFLRINC